MNLFSGKNQVLIWEALETKLLYTLHWILLDAADECALDEHENTGKIDSSPFAYLFPLSSISVSGRIIQTFYLIIQINCQLHMDINNVFIN